MELPGELLPRRTVIAPVRGAAAPAPNEKPKKRAPLLVLAPLPVVAANHGLGEPIAVNGHVPCPLTFASKLPLPALVGITMFWGMKVTLQVCAIAEIAKGTVISRPRRRVCTVEVATLERVIGFKRRYYQLP